MKLKNPLWMLWIKKRRFIYEKKCTKVFIADPRPCRKFSIYKIKFLFFPPLYLTTSLEANNISLSVAVEVVQDISLKLSKVPGILGKMNRKKNTVYQAFTKISTGEEILKIP